MNQQGSSAKPKTAKWIILAPIVCILCWVYVLWQTIEDNKGKPLPIESPIDEGWETRDSEDFDWIE